MAYSNDLRERVLKYVENGSSKTEAAGIFGVCLKTINVYKNHRVHREQREREVK